MICPWCGVPLQRVDYPEPGIIVEFLHPDGTADCPLPRHQRVDAPTLLERLTGPDTRRAPLGLENLR